MSSSKLLEQARELREKKAFDRDYGESALLGGTLGTAVALGTLPSILRNSKNNPKRMYAAGRVGNALLKGYGLGSLVGLGAEALRKRNAPSYY